MPRTHVRGLAKHCHPGPKLNILLPWKQFAWLTLCQAAGLTAALPGSAAGTGCYVTCRCSTMPYDFAFVWHVQVSDRAKKRGKTQLGTLGAGNHYVEVQVTLS